VADSAEPKSISEISSYGVVITGADKGKDSVNHGIQLVQNQKISVTKRSVNIIKEYRNYLWETDKNGKILNTPEHSYSHSMDAIRYGLVSLLKSQSKTSGKEMAKAIQSYYSSNFSFTSDGQAPIFRPELTL
jgi:phage terminase large subunit